MSAVIALARPHRIKASHRRRRRVASGHLLYILNNPLSGTDPTGYQCTTDASGDECAASAGSGNTTKIVSQQAGSRIKQTAGTLTNNGNGTATVTANNGKSQTISLSGASGGQSVVGASSRQNQAASASEKGSSAALGSSTAASGQLRMPWDRNPPDTNNSSYPLTDFPINKLSRSIDSDGTLAITGSFSVEGTAAEDDMLTGMTNLYSSRGTLDDGKTWRTSIQFVRAAAGQAGDIQMNWMNEQFFSQHPDLDRQGTGGYMGFGSKSMWLNQTLFDRNMLTQSNLVPSRRIDEFNNYLRAYTPGHEFFHGMGFGHSRNSTGSISSYARRPQMTNTDFGDMWNILKDNRR